jgi:L-ribulose-5-phosphate 4-epimerase
MAWPFSVSAIAHTHSTYAVAYAQAGLPIEPEGVTHADNFGGRIPITRALRDDELDDKYSENVGNLIVATAVQPERVPAVLLDNHGPFTWGSSPLEAVKNMIVLEELAQSSFLTKMLNPKAESISDALLNHHYDRRVHYGQK